MLGESGRPAPAMGAPVPHLPLVDKDHDRFSPDVLGLCLNEPGNLDGMLSQEKRGEAGEQGGGVEEQEAF